MANEKCRTHTVATAADDLYLFPTDPDTLVALKNIGSNIIWISHDSTAAAAEASNCEAVLPGEVVYVPWESVIPGTANSGGVRLIAATADTKLNMVNSMGRTRR